MAHKPFTFVTGDRSLTRRRFVIIILVHPIDDLLRGGMDTLTAQGNTAYIFNPFKAVGKGEKTVWTAESICPV